MYVHRSKKMSSGKSQALEYSIYAWQVFPSYYTILCTGCKTNSREGYLLGLIQLAFFGQLGRFV